MQFVYSMLIKCANAIPPISVVILSISRTIVCFILILEDHTMRKDKTKLSLESIENISERMPGGFFIYKADENEELIAYNDVVLNTYGCADRASFKKLTGGTFKGMVHPDDYKNVDDSILDQISADEEKFDHVEYRIIKNDGSVAYVDDFGKRIYAV